MRAKRKKAGYGMKYDSQILEDNHLKKAWYNAGVKL